MAMGIGFGYYAYFDAAQMVAPSISAARNGELVGQLDALARGFFNNQIFDLFINQTYTVMSNEGAHGLSAVPLHGPTSSSGPTSSIACSRR
ncbi:MAG: hypothetical protein R3D52_05300 [Xanthobacteraceae bacterium]